MPKEPVWIRTEAVLAIHQQQVSEHGGMQGVRDTHLLEAAVARPRQLFAYQQPLPTLSQLSAAYGYGLIRNHPFVDGNKRTGLVTLGTFLGLNGLPFLASPEEMFTMIRAVAAGVISEPELAAWVERQSVR